MSGFRYTHPVGRGEGIRNFRGSPLPNPSKRSGVGVTVTLEGSGYPDGLARSSRSSEPPTSPRCSVERESTSGGESGIGSADDQTDSYPTSERLCNEEANADDKRRQSHNVKDSGGSRRWTEHPARVKIAFVE